MQRQHCAREPENCAPGSVTQLVSLSIPHNTHTLYLSPHTTCTTHLPNTYYDLSDGKIEEWHHFECFFKKYRITHSGYISGLTKIRWGDRETIEEQIKKDLIASGKIPEKRSAEQKKQRKALRCLFCFWPGTGGDRKRDLRVRGRRM